MKLAPLPHSMDASLFLGVALGLATTVFVSATGCSSGAPNTDTGGGGDAAGESSPGDAGSLEGSRDGGENQDSGSGSQDARSEGSHDSGNADACPYTDCGGKCVDTMGSDNANCGGCGKTCAHQCNTGVCTQVVASVSAPSSITSDGTNVYWLSTANGAVQYCPVAGCSQPASPSTLATPGNNGTPAGDVQQLVLAKGTAYFDSVPFGGGNPTIYECPLTGCAGTPHAYTASTLSSGTDVVADTTNLYWAGNEIDECALGASCATPKGLSTFSGAGAMGLSGGTLYWFDDSFNPAGNSINGAAVSGAGSVTTVCTTSTVASDLVVAGSYLYFTDASPGSSGTFASSGVYVCPLSGGGGPASLYISDTKGAYGLASDGVDLYWTEALGCTATTCSGAIKKCALGASCASPTTYVSGQAMPVSIALTSTDVFWGNVANTLTEGVWKGTK
jgi:hypothetical protein